MKISEFVKSTKGFINRHSPEILTGIGVAGMITTTVLAVKATPKALQLIEEAKDELEHKCDKLPVQTVIKVAWKPYIPAVITGIASASCIIGASAVNSKRHAALATAYAISEKTLLTYRDKVIETIGEKKEKSIREKIAQDEVNANPPVSSQVILTSKGNTLCRDYYSGRDFRSDLDSIRKAVIELNRRVVTYNYVSLTEFYTLINLEPIKTSDRLGWNLDDGEIEMIFSTTLVNDEPCVVLDFNVAPKYNFDKFM